MSLGWLKRKVRLPVWGILLLVIIPAIAAYGFGHWGGAAGSAAIVAGLSAAWSNAAKRRREREREIESEHHETVKDENERFEAELENNREEAERETDPIREDVDAATSDAASLLNEIRSDD